MLSPIFVSALLCCLKECGVECYWGGNFVGCVGDADDLGTAPSLPALRIKLPICEEFA